MVLCDEFSNWQDSSRSHRYPLHYQEAQLGWLSLSELRMRPHGAPGHPLRLQWFEHDADQAVGAHSHYLKDDPEGAKKEILEFWKFDTIDEVELFEGIKIILAASNFRTN